MVNSVGYALLSNLKSIPVFYCMLYVYYFPFLLSQDNVEEPISKEKLASNCIRICDSSCSWVPGVTQTFPDRESWFPLTCCMPSVRMLGASLPT